MKMNEGINDTVAKIVFIETKAFDAPMAMMTYDRQCVSE